MNDMVLKLKESKKRHRRRNLNCKKYADSDHTNKHRPMEKEVKKCPNCFPFWSVLFSFMSHPVLFQGYLEDSLMATKRCMSQDYRLQMSHPDCCFICRLWCSIEQREEEFTTQIPLLRLSAMSWPSRKSFPSTSPWVWLSVISPHPRNREWQLLSEALWALEGHLVLKRGPEQLCY